MRLRAILAIVLIAVALAGLGGYRARASVAHTLTEQRERAETLAAWPALREWASLRGGRAATPGTDGAGIATDPAASSAALGRGLGIAAGTVRKALGALRAKLGAGPDADGAALVALARADRGDLVGVAADRARPRAGGQPLAAGRGDAHTARGTGGRRSSTTATPAGGTPSTCMPT